MRPSVIGTVLLLTRLRLTHTRPCVVRDVKEVRTTCVDTFLLHSCVKRRGSLDVRERSEFPQYQLAPLVTHPSTSHVKKAR